MNATQRKEYWMKFERMRKQLDAKYLSKTKDSILKQFARFGKDIDEFGIDAAKSRLGLDLWEKELIKVFEELYKESAVLFGNAVYRAVKIEANQKGETFGFNRQWTEDVLNFLMQKGFILVSEITSTTKDRMLKIVEDAIIKGYGYKEIAKLFMQDQDIAGFLTVPDIQGYAEMRAKRIVRTEVMRASNIGAMQGASAHPFEVDKQWISARDNRTRRIPRDEFDHKEMDGQVKAFNEPFTSTGKKGEPVVIQQPGQLSDPSNGIIAPAGFTINCRCTVGFIPKRDANGRLIMKPKLSAPQIG